MFSLAVLPFSMKKTAFFIHCTIFWTVGDILPKCFSPLFAYQSDMINPLTGNKFPPTFLHDLSDQDKLDILSGRVDNFNGNRLLVLPCQRCLACRLNRTSTWALRCACELPYHEHSYALTLTYDDDHLPMTYLNADVSDRINPVTGEVIGDLQMVPTLHIKDVQDFFKRLLQYEKRELNVIGIRRFYCGEYGDLRKRPHYHALVFGLEIPDLVKTTEKSSNGFPLYSSKIISKLWQYGLVRIQPGTIQTARYIAGYIYKKQVGLNSSVYSDIGISAPFVHMSNDPGIGYRWLVDHPHIYDYDEIHIRNNGVMVSTQPPKYYDHIFERLSSDLSICDDLPDETFEYLSDPNFDIQAIRDKRRAEAEERSRQEFSTVKDLSAYFETKRLNLYAKNRQKLHRNID